MEGDAAGRGLPYPIPTLRIPNVPTMGALPLRCALRDDICRFSPDRSFRIFPTANITEERRGRDSDEPLSAGSPSPTPFPLPKRGRSIPKPSRTGDPIGHGIGPGHHRSTPSAVSSGREP